MKKTCVACKREYDGHFNSNVCSAECRQARRRGRDNGVDALPPPQRTCVICGKSFHHDRGNRVTCSKECLQEKRRARWRQYWVDHPEKMREQMAKRKERVATDKEFAKKINKRKYEKIKADPERLARTRASNRETYGRHAERIQRERRERLRALPDAELIEYLERMRRYGREFRRRRRADPETLAEDQAYQREFRRRRNAERLATEAAILQREIGSRAGGESTALPPRRGCLVCGRSLAGRHTSALVCSPECRNVRHTEYVRKRRERQAEGDPRA